MIFEVETESMKYKKIINKSKDELINSSTKEYIIFKDTSNISKKVKVSFLFDWSYDTDGFCYKHFYHFSGHKKRNEEEKNWLENYCKENYPDGHHMSY